MNFLQQNVVEMVSEVPEYNMSRSNKKIPIVGHAGDSEKQDKKRWHRSFRKKSKDAINKSHYDLDTLHDTIFPTRKDVSNPWSMSKDGKHYWNPKNVPGYLIELFKKAMRK